MNHCKSCCPGETVKGIAALLSIGLAIFAVVTFAPEDWGFWKQTAAVVVLMGLWR